MTNGDGYGYIERITKDDERFLRIHYDDCNDKRTYSDYYEPEWVKELESKVKALKEELGKTKADLHIMNEQEVILKEIIEKIKRFVDSSIYNEGDISNNRPSKIEILNELKTILESMEEK